MSILVNTVNEQEEKILLAFLDSMDIRYTTALDGSQMAEDFIVSYNKEINKADNEIESGNYLSQDDVVLLFEKRRQAFK